MMGDNGRLTKKNGPRSRGVNIVSFKDFIEDVPALPWGSQVMRTG